MDGRRERQKDGRTDGQTQTHKKMQMQCKMCGYTFDQQKRARRSLESSDDIGGRGRDDVESSASNRVSIGASVFELCRLP